MRKITGIGVALFGEALKEVGALLAGQHAEYRRWRKQCVFWVIPIDGEQRRWWW